MTTSPNVPDSPDSPDAQPTVPLDELFAPDAAQDERMPPPPPPAQPASGPTAAAASASTPATWRPLFGTIVWGVLLLVFAAFMVVWTIVPTSPDPTLWLLGAVIVTGLLLVVAGIVAAARRAG